MNSSAIYLVSLDDAEVKAGNVDVGWNKRYREALQAHELEISATRPPPPSSIYPGHLCYNAIPCYGEADGWPVDAVIVWSPSSLVSMLHTVAQMNITEIKHTQLNTLVNQSVHVVYTLSAGCDIHFYGVLQHNNRSEQYFVTPVATGGTVFAFKAEYMTDITPARPPAVPGTTIFVNNSKTGPARPTR